MIHSRIGPNKGFIDSWNRCYRALTQAEMKLFVASIGVSLGITCYSPQAAGNYAMSD